MTPPKSPVGLAIVLGSIGGFIIDVALGGLHGGLLFPLGLLALVGIPVGGIRCAYELFLDDGPSRGSSWAGLLITAALVLATVAFNFR